MQSGSKRTSDAFFPAPGGLRAFICACLLCGALAGCDSGLEPPEQPALGTIYGVVHYSGPWPPAAQLRDLRFVAMQFVPADTADFLQLNRMAISDRLEGRVATDTFLVRDVPAGTYPYAGIAQQFARDLLSWRPVGLVDDSDLPIVVRPGEQSSIRIDVDFNDLPVFPPATSEVNP